MTQGEIHPHAVEPMAPRGSEHWSERIPQLQHEIATLTGLLAALSTEEHDAQEQLQSLTYATDLTKGEAQRRARANSELSTVYADPPPEDPEAAQLRQVQLLEGQLLNAKRDAATLTFDVEQLDFRLKRLREKVPDARHALKSGLHGPVSPASPVLPSPQLSSFASRNSSSIKTSPLSRPSRLIGDVDSLVSFGEDPAVEGEGADGYAPCRLGVGTSGQMALYSYASAMPLLYLDDRSAKMEVLTERDSEALRKSMNSVDLQIAGTKYELCGLKESVAASLQLIQDASQLLKTDDEEIQPQA